MKLIRYLLSHIILLAFLVALGFAYYHRARLFTDEINAKIDNSVHRVMVLVKLAPEQPKASEDNLPAPETAVNEQTTPTEVVQVSEVEAESKDKPATSLPDEEPEIASATDVATVAATDQGQPPTAEATTDSAAETTGPATEQVAESVSGEPAPASADPSAEAAPQVTETVIAQADDVSESTLASEPDQIATASTDKEAVATSHAELIGQARQAFQSGDSNKAISLYQELADLNPEDPNVYGEMGNVLYAQGKWKEAGKAYYEAAIRLKIQGRMGQVQYLYRVIQGLDQASAEKLRSQLVK